MVSGKKRLYVAMYPSGVSNNEEKRYHWAFVVGHKTEKESALDGMKYHAKNRPVTGWMYEELAVPDMQRAETLLGRLLVAKIEDEKRLVDIFREVPLVQGKREWNCRSWIEDALKRIAADEKAVGTSILDWAVIERKGRDYVGRKMAAGRYATTERLESSPRPTYDMLRNREVFA